MFQGDREGEFEPQLIPEGVRRFSGFDDKVISLLLWPLNIEHYIVA